MRAKCPIVLVDEIKNEVLEAHDRKTSKRLSALISVSKTSKILNFPTVSVKKEIPDDSTTQDPPKGTLVESTKRKKKDGGVKLVDEILSDESTQSDELPQKGRKRKRISVKKEKAYTVLPLTANKKFPGYERIDIAPPKNWPASRRKAWICVYEEKEGEPFSGIELVRERTSNELWNFIDSIRSDNWRLTKEEESPEESVRKLLEEKTKKIKEEIARQKQREQTVITSPSTSEDAQHLRLFSRAPPRANKQRAHYGIKPTSHEQSDMVMMNNM